MFLSAELVRIASIIASYLLGMSGEVFVPVGLFTYQTPLGFSRLALFPANRAASPVRAPWAGRGAGAVGQVDGRAYGWGGGAGLGPEREGTTGVVADPARLGPLSKI